MDKRSHKVSKRNITFDVCYTLLMVHNVLISFSTLDVPQVIQITMLVTSCFSFVVLLLCSATINLKRIFICILLIALGCVSYYGSRKMDLFYFAFFMFLCQYVDIDYFWKIDFRNRLWLIVALLCLSVFGVIENRVFTKSSLFGIEKIGYGYGFKNSNNFGLFLYLLFIDIVFLAKEGSFSSRKVAESFMALFFMLVALSSSRTAMLLMLVSFFVYLTWKKNIFFSCKLMDVVKFAPVGFLIISRVLIGLYESGNSVVKMLNILTTGRISLWEAFARNYPISLIGNIVIYRSASLYQSAVVCDNIYLYLLHNLGLIATCVWIFGITHYLTNKENRSYLAVIFILIFLLYGLVENTMSNVFFFPFIVYVSKSVFGIKIDKSAHKEAI